MFYSLQFFELSAGHRDVQFDGGYLCLSVSDNDDERLGNSTNDGVVNDHQDVGILRHLVKNSREAIQLDTQRVELLSYP